MENRKTVLDATENLVRLIKSSAAGAAQHELNAALDLRDETVSKILSAFGEYSDTAQSVTNVARWWAENATRSDSILLSAIETLSEGIALYDPEDRLVFCNSRMVRWNPASAHLMLPGVQFEELLRTNVAADEIKGAEEEKAAFIAERLESHRNPNGSLIQQRKDGSWFEITEERTADGFTFVLNIDITDRKKAEEALIQSEERFRHFAEASSDWFWEMDENFAFSYISGGFEAFTGHSSENYLGKTRWDIDGPPLPISKWAEHKADMLAHRSFKDFVYEYRSGAFVSISGAPYFDKAGVFKGYRGAARDITAAKLTEDKLRQSQRLDAVGQLTGGVAHDFNNLLAVILGNLEVLEDLDLPESGVAMLDRAKSASLRASDLTRNMLAFARRAPLDPKRLDVNGAAREAQNWIGRTLPSSVSIETSLLAGLWPINADASSLESAILNLMLNARDAMGGQGKLTIETANVRVDEDYVRSREEELIPGRYVMLAISDTGHGISKEDLQQIFEPFHTTKEVGEGSGLGLSMVMGFMKQSGGTVRVYSEVGVGTTFKLFFPAATTSDEIDDVALPVETQRNSDGARILLAEDEPDVRATLTDILEDAGYSVTAVATGDAAYSVFEADPTFDLLLTDIVMPGTLQGTDLARKLRTGWPDLAVAFMSGYANEATVHGNGLRPEDIRMMKPVRRKDLLTALSNSLGSQVETN